MGECEVDNEASVSSGGAHTCMEVTDSSTSSCASAHHFFLFLDGAASAHGGSMVSPNENVAGSELVM